jgi:hypothetical protein
MSGFGNKPPFPEDSTPEERRAFLQKAAQALGPVWDVYNMSDEQIVERLFEIVDTPDLLPDNYAAVCFVAATRLAGRRVRRSLSPFPALTRIILEEKSTSWTRRRRASLSRSPEP